MDRRAHGAAISVLCGVMIAAGGGLAFVMPPADPPVARSVAGTMILAGGTAEMLVGLFGAHVERGWTDVGLGLLSLAAASVLFVATDLSALSFAWLLSVWLLARGATELIGGLASARAIVLVGTARLMRATVDLTLGLLALIGALAAAFPAFLLDWPSAVLRMILLYVAISLIASAAVHVAVAFAFRGARSQQSRRT